MVSLHPPELVEYYRNLLWKLVTDPPATEVPPVSLDGITVLTRVLEVTTNPPH